MKHSNALKCVVAYFGPSRSKTRVYRYALIALIGKMSLIVCIAIAKADFPSSRNTPFRSGLVPQARTKAKA